MPKFVRRGQTTCSCTDPIQPSRRVQRHLHETTAFGPMGPIDFRGHIRQVEDDYPHLVEGMRKPTRPVLTPPEHEAFMPRSVDAIARQSEPCNNPAGTCQRGEGARCGMPLVSQRRRREQRPTNLPSTSTLRKRYLTVSSRSARCVPNPGRWIWVVCPAPPGRDQNIAVDDAARRHNKIIAREMNGGDVGVQDQFEREVRCWGRLLFATI